MPNRVPNLALGLRVLLMLVLGSLWGLVSGCASSGGGVGDPYAQADAAMSLRSGESAWVRIQADQAEALIINQGPGNLEIRIPALGGDVIRSLSLAPGGSFRDQFFVTRSIGFRSIDGADWVRFHYYIKGDKVEVAYHGPLN